MGILKNFLPAIPVSRAATSIGHILHNDELSQAINNSREESQTAAKLLESTIRDLLDAVQPKG